MTGIFIDEFNRHMITIFMIILFSIKLWTRRAIRDMETRCMKISQNTTERAAETVVPDRRAIRFERQYEYI